MKFTYETEEQSLECYSLWQTFKNMVDERLQQFISEQVEGVTNDMILESLERVKEAEPGMLSCIDYLMACSEYTDFLNLMLDFKEGYEYEYQEENEGEGEGEGAAEEAPAENQ